MLCCRSCTATCTWKRFMALSFHSDRCNGRRAGSATAAVLGEVADQCVHVVEVSGVDDEAAFLAVANQAGVREVRQMEGERCRRELQSLSDRACGQPLRPCLNQKSEDRETGLMRQRRKRCDCLCRFHVSRIVEMISPRQVLHER